MKELQLIDRVVVEIKSEEDSQSRNTQMAALLQDVSEQILNGMKGNESLHTSPTGIHTEVLWERECTDFGFRMGDKSLISMHYYNSEPKPDKYVLIAHNYDRENSSAYPVDNKLFATEEEARQYLRDNIESIKSNHWTYNRVDGEDGYYEEFTSTGWEAKDMNDGSCLEVEVSQLKEE